MLWWRPIIERCGGAGLVVLAAEPTPNASIGPRFPTKLSSSRRPLLQLAFSGADEALREALDAEVRAEQAKDRAYWAPLKAELEAFRRAEREGA